MLKEQIIRNIDERVQFPELQPDNPDRFLDTIGVTYQKRDEWVGLRHILEVETVDVSYRVMGVRKEGIGFRVNDRNYAHVLPVYSQQAELDAEVRSVMARSLPSDVLRVAGIEPFIEQA